MTNYTDDTQPRSPFVPSPELLNPEEDATGPGCLIWGLVGLASVIIAVLIVFLAGYSGWNAGLRIARAEATQTRAADVIIQCEFIGRDINNGNSPALIQKRFDDLSQQTPVPDCVARLAPSATAYAVAQLSTPTATVTPTLPPTSETPPPSTAEATSEPANATSGFDITGLLDEAQSQVALAQWEDAILTLDAIAAIDPNYEKARVERLLFQALTAQANLLYQTGRLAEAIVLTDRAEQYGDIQGLNYERFIASIYLDAQRYVDINYSEAIRLLSRIVYEQNLPNYQGGAAARLLYAQLVKYGDAFAASGDSCSAVAQYDRAIQLSQNVSGVNGQADTVSKRDSAQTACLQSTLQPELGTADPNATPEPTIAPVGAVGP